MRSLSVLILSLLLFVGVVAQNPPTNLRSSAVLGVNVIRFDGNNKLPVRYEVYRLYGDTVDYYLWRVTDSTVLIDDDVVAGQYYQYKVRAVSRRGVSAFSNVTMLYNWGE